MPKHPKADLLIAIANGEQMQVMVSFGEWKDCSAEAALLSIADCRYEVRIKPKIIFINCIDVPAPVTEPLEMGQEYWTFGVIDKNAFRSTWIGHPSDELHLKRRTIHLTKEAAQAHLEAIVKASGGEV